MRRIFSDWDDAPHQRACTRQDKPFRSIGPDIVREAVGARVSQNTIRVETRGMMYCRQVLGPRAGEIGLCCCIGRKQMVGVDEEKFLIIHSITFDDRFDSALHPATRFSLE
jgi:hypothetical protein